MTKFWVTKDGEFGGSELVFTELTPAQLAQLQDMPESDRFAFALSIAPAQCIRCHMVDESSLQNFDYIDGDIYCGACIAYLHTCEDCGLDIDDTIGNSILEFDGNRYCIPCIADRSECDEFCGLCGNAMNGHVVNCELGEYLSAKSEHLADSNS